tara:strand:- start:135 stop:392 length:258 start_codon:yes stop_codon:yes gene_type:complete
MSHIFLNQNESEKVMMEYQLKYVDKSMANITLNIPDHINDVINNMIDDGISFEQCLNRILSRDDNGWELVRLHDELIKKHHCNGG